MLYPTITLLVPCPLPPIVRTSGRCICLTQALARAFGEQQSHKQFEASGPDTRVSDGFMVFGLGVNFGFQAPLRPELEQAALVSGLATP